ncbi:MAG: YlbE-like family protein [Faecalibacillus sp.]
MVMNQEVREYLRNHPKWYVTLSRYPESYYDLINEIEKQKHSTFLEKLDKVSLFIQMLEMLK